MAAQRHDDGSTSQRPDIDEYVRDSAVPLHPPIDDEVRAPLTYAYTATEIMNALPRSNAVDATALPADLQRKAAEHGDDLSDITRSENLAAPRPLLARIGDRLRWRHRPEPAWVYTADEVATLDAAALDWPAVPEELDRYASAETLRREWHKRWMWRMQPGAAALVWREPHLVAVAHLLGREIRSSAAWNSDLFDVHRVRIDLAATLSDIYLRAHRIWRARANLVPPPTAAPDDVVARRNAEITDAATAAWDTLVNLVRQLQDYRTQLAPIDAVFAEITALHQSGHRITDSAVHQLHVDAAGNTLQTGDINEVTSELADLNANLTTRLGALHHSLTATTNGLLLSAP
ncbi:hypothetical protein [Mycolicibacterium fortuitum]|uniref:hypothetical protein n=1 Tax=Mycolicibacterium fortuitum TaxID=1766 RepID=UPI003AB017F3